jgi:chromosome segregation protein
MRLSRLHITGFKSFPDRAELGFDDGVTAIVGPNGCGKSNVVDAITWVLGEQSAKSLRGERMEDVIFNGSDARKPTAAAEVRLKLADVAQAAVAETVTDPLLDEQPLLTRDVEIGRRLYRSGESEYLIDGEVCRLRDVHDLLMDSGLGVKAYAVIEQGKIGQILSSRPAERRMLIEEAAGVTKYKSRRRAAELKLEAAQQNLTRVDDIIFEVEKQRGALRRQAARARRYKRLREELRRWEQVQLAHRHEKLSADIDAADRILAEARAREAAAAAHVAELETALETLRLGLTEAESGATSAREHAHALELEIGRRQQQIQFDRQQIDELARQADSFAAELQDLEGRRDPARLALETQRAAASRMQATQAEATRQVEAAEAEYARALASVQTIEQESDATRAAVLAAAGTLSALRQARENAAVVRDRVAAERERLEIEARDLDAQAARAVADHEEASQALAAARDALAAAVHSREAGEAELAARRAEREQIAADLGAAERDLAAREARLKTLEELEASRATYGDAARFLLADAPGGVKQLGAVADHLTVERTYERAVDALMGHLLQHVVVERTQDVAAALALLTERDAGRCGFVVLAEAGDKAAADAPLVVPSGSRALSTVVRAAGPHAAVVSRLIGRALVVDTFEAARDLARTVSVPVAARSGEVFRGAWLVEGGSRQDARGVLESRAEMLALRDEVQESAARTRTLAAQRAALDGAVPAAETALTGLVAAQHEQEKAIVALESRLARAQEERSRLGLRLDVVGTERRRAIEEEQAAERRRDDAGAAIVRHETDQREAENRLGGVAADLQAAREVAEGRLRLVTDARTSQAALGERAAVLGAETARLEEAATDLETRITGRRADIDRTDTRRTELRASIHDGEHRVDADIRELQGHQAQIRDLDARVTALRADFNTRDHDIRGARHRTDAVRAEVTQAEVARATAAADLAHLAETCLETLGAPVDEVVSRVAQLEAAGELVAPARRVAAAAAPEADEFEPAEAGAAPETPADLEAAGLPEDDETPLTPEEIIADLKRKLEKLGPVNMMAIEQFDELETRHSFLTTQRKDLLDSIAQTGEAIRRIDKTTRERFEEAFHSINVHFEKTFTTLFGGGRAGLVLIDQENDPESGIDIIAQPPGKRLQNVMLLSGGEKALTAMALMFAIFKHRPSPFCLLDEIDAPLDDANIGRFVEMLQGLQTSTQFILITHNRKTMEIADRLYGVTMEEPGVSKLISLQLN